MNRVVVLATFLGACMMRGPVPVESDVAAGPAAAVRPGRILVLQPTCGSLEERCPKTYIAAVDNIVRTSLEATGLAVVDPEHLRLEPRQRTETHETTESAGSSIETTTVVLDGPGFDDLTPLQRDEVLDQAGADSVVVTRVILGAQQSLLPNMPSQRVEVLVRLSANRGDTMAWASRCSATTSESMTVTTALEQAARCAVYGGTGN